jgi:LysW-gamma-L-lysine carboxypeptidase
MRELGFTRVRTDEAGNAIGEVGSGHPHVLLCGHMDTVPGRLTVKAEGGRIYGRGAVDAKSPMCALICAASRLIEKGGGPKPRVTVACVTREEGDSLGIRKLIEAGGDYDCAIFGEPGGASRIAVGYRGRTEARLDVRTRGGHAAASWISPSALGETIGLLDLLRRYEADHSAANDHYRSVNITPTILRGGSYSNVVPKSCMTVLDVRIPPGTTSESVSGDLGSVVQAYATQHPDAKVSITFSDEPTEPYEVPGDALVLRALQRSIIRTISARPTLTHKTGTGDMNTLAQTMRIPCVTYGPGDSKLEHTDYEAVDVADYLNAIGVLENALGEVASLSLAQQLRQS